MGTLKSFANLYRSEFEDRYCDELLRSVSQKYPIYGIPLADNGMDSVYGFIQLLTQGNKELAVLLDYRIMKI
ncbi:MAG TPA: hypothetical protein VJ001_03035 [Rhodocyclaceae bacterium]|nr:hypothetical protein [Rhodocyclaceae bacterium]